MVPEALPAEPIFSALWIPLCQPASESLVSAVRQITLQLLIGVP